MIVVGATCPNNLKHFSGSGNPENAKFVICYFLREDAGVRSVSASKYQARQLEISLPCCFLVTLRKTFPGNQVVLSWDLFID